MNIHCIEYCQDSHSEACTLGCPEICNSGSILMLIEPNCLYGILILSKKNSRNSDNNLSPLKPRSSAIYWRSALYMVVMQRVGRLPRKSIISLSCHQHQNRTTMAYFGTPYCTSIPLSLYQPSTQA